jgi:transcriptional regulator with XRE-family HTH domain
MPSIICTMHIGQKIKKIRELRNLTQEYLANQIGMRQESYSKIETNRHSVTMEKLEKIAETLGMNVQDLINFDEQRVLFNIQNNNQQDAQIGYFQEVETLKALYDKMLSQQTQLYDKIIQQQREEIAFLRSLLQEKKNH